MSDNTDPGYGPWPQPAPTFFEDAAPAVLHVPEDVQKDWNKHVGWRYTRQVLFDTLPTWIWAQFNPGVVEVSDTRFCQILCDGIFSKFLTEKKRFDAPDIALFRDYLDTAPDHVWFKSDFRPMRHVKSEKDSATAPSVVLFKSVGTYAYEVVAIAVDDKVFDPSHGGAWTLAKYFALQGAGVITTLLMHPKLHFPSNSVDAITRTRLPPGGTLAKLLRPHFRLALAVNHAVLYGEQTVLKPGRLYAPYPGTLEEHARVVATLWRGLPFNDDPKTPNQAYPKYRLERKPPEIHSAYGDFLGHYHRTLLGFIREVATDIVSAKTNPVSRWADHCAQWLPGFPDSSEVYRGDALAEALTSIVLDVAVAHSADHYIYGQVNEREVPFRLHSKLPDHANQEEPDLKTLVNSGDNFNYRMCTKMFFKPYVIERLADVDYGFKNKRLREANKKFRRDLVALQDTLVDEGIPRYVPLHEIATSVQF
ncbi:MAG: hypothetical protein AB8I08_06605 [Sandaracinaceae bacterium]